MKPVHSLLIPAIALFFIASKCGGAQQQGHVSSPETDSLVLKLLGPQRVALIRATDRVRVRSLVPDANGGQWREVLAEPSRVPDLVSILCRKESYSFSKVLEKCPLAADVHILLSVGQGPSADSLLVLVNIQCQSWQYVYHGQAVAEDRFGPQNAIAAWVSAVLPPASAEKNADQAQHSPQSERPDVKKDTSIPKTSGKPAGAEPGPATNLLEQRFGADIAQTILQAGTVSAYVLDPEKAPPAGSNTFNGFAVVQEQEKLSAPLSKKLLAILSAPKHHLESRLAKNCTFLPDIGFRLLRTENGKSDYVDVLVAFYCDDWMFKDSNGSRYIRDCAPARKELLELVRKIFPGDEYFKRLPLENN